MTIPDRGAAAQRIALLIDADNVSADVIDQAVERVLQLHGAIHVRRAYCTTELALANLPLFKRHSIRPIVNLSTGKNSTDIALAVDAIDMVVTERPDLVVIVSSDSDFAPLVIRLREKGCRVEGIGQLGKTGEDSKGVYDDFIDLAHHKSRAVAPGRAPARKRAAAGPVTPDAGSEPRAPRRAAAREPAGPAGDAGRGERSAALASRPAVVERDDAGGRPPAQPPARAARPTRSAPRSERPEGPAGRVAVAVREEAAVPGPIAAVRGRRRSTGTASGGATGTASGGTSGAAPRPLPALESPAAVAARSVPNNAGGGRFAARDIGAAGGAAGAVRGDQAGSSGALSALPDDVARILRAVPELARGGKLELGIAAELLRAEKLLAKSATSTRLFKKYPDHFALTPERQPNKVQYLGPRRG